jgi:hypothetical protein
VNKEVKRAWVEALRSGKYKQATGRLRRVDGYCCLGVLCNLYKESHQDCNWSEESDCFCFVIHEENTDPAMDFLPEKVVEWAGLDSSDPHDGTLVGLNDRGATFDEIADVIEENL